MDFSQLNAAEQAQMSKILEKKQVRLNFGPVQWGFAEGTRLLDARLLEDVLQPS